MIDLALVDRLLHEARQAIPTIEKAAAGIADDTLRKKADAAQVNRDLLHLADKLDLAAGLVRNEYWALKGRPNALTGDSR